MKTSYKIILLIVLTAFVSCKKEEQITNKKDYVQYLNTDQSELIKNLENEHSFWTKKLEKTPNQFPYLAKIASAESNMFENTGSIQHLINAEQRLVEINTKTNYNNAGYLRMLSRNYISQHKFNEALSLLKKAETNGENLISTQKMLFDVYLELGNSKETQKYLSLIEDKNDFDYLIRQSKWSDHEGDLELAIFYMKKATKIAEQLKNNTLIQWSYTNLADFLGHANQIEASYNYYLKALKLNPNDSYAKKGIAWIIYSHEKNPTEAIEILNKISQDNIAPDYHLLKAEIYEYMNQGVQKKEALNSYITLVENELYGSMYNTYNANVYLDELNNTTKAIEIAKQEIKNRPTAQSYDLLAWSYFKNGNTSKAYDIVNQHVVNKTSEPEILYHVAEIYKANNDMSFVNTVKQELLDSSYELGPLMTQKIKVL
jgi:tetratricopeptide (TPR) repeat protein